MLCPQRLILLVAPEETILGELLLIPVVKPRLVRLIVPLDAEINLRYL